MKSTSSSTEVYDLFDEIISKFNAEGRISTASAYKDARNSLAGYKAKLKFKQVTVQFLKNYEARMKEEGKTISTIGIYLRHLRAIYNQSNRKAAIIDQKYYPFGKNRYQIKAPRNIKKALTIEQIIRSLITKLKKELRNILSETSGCSPICVME
jgi:integrase/recombinase XerD